MSAIEQSVVFLGAGSMAEAILKGMLAKGVFPAERIAVVNRNNARRLEELHSEYRIRIPSGETEKAALIRQADIVILAVKPKDVAQTLNQYNDALHERQFLISVVAGLKMNTLGELLGKTLPLARTMPNTSSTIGLGATDISFTENTTSEQRDTVLHIFRSIGTVSVVDEPLLDVVTGVSGSGPAYAYYLMEAMIAAGVEGGLDPAAARALTVQTVLGAAQMLLSTGEDPAVLRRKVTSPGGTTQAALETLDDYRFYEAVKSAVLRAAKRAGELGEMIGRSHD